MGFGLAGVSCISLFRSPSYSGLFPSTVPSLAFMHEAGAQVTFVSGTEAAPT